MSLSSYQEYQVKRDETSVEVKYHSQARDEKKYIWFILLSFH